MTVKLLRETYVPFDSTVGVRVITVHAGLKWRSHVVVDTDSFTEDLVHLTSLSEMTAGIVHENLIGGAQELCGFILDCRK